MIDTITEQNITVKKVDTEVNSFLDEDNHAIFWMQEGFRSISVDFNKFSLQPNSIYFITAGKQVSVTCSGQPKGWILKFPNAFIREHIQDHLFVKNVEIYTSDGEIPRIVLSPKIGERVHSIIEMIDELVEADHPHKEAASASLLKTLLLYCDSHCNIRVTVEDNRHQLSIVTTFKNLVAKHYNHLHSVSHYAELMNISPKYLNQIVKKVLGVTAKTIIQEQLILQARRDLKFSDGSIKEIAYSLGFSDPFYFSNYFKKEMGCSPSEYRVQ